MRKLKTVISAVAISVIAISAIAMSAPATCLAAGLNGPYCVAVPGFTPDCKYYDERSCARAAVERQGACIDRSSGFALLGGPNGRARYCLINAGDTRCNYYDEVSCARAIKELGGGFCVERVRAHPGS